MLRALPLVFIFIGLALYTVLGGADFGAGFWQLFAGRGQRGLQVREKAHDAMAPVWEANHVWLVFVLTVCWTAYPQAFASIASTLAVPLFIALLGIIFRGAAYALRSGTASARESAVVDTIFASCSILTPLALGCAIGAIAIGKVPVGNAAGGLFSSWLNPCAVLIGVLAVGSCAYLAAVYLAADCARDGQQELERAFRSRALGAGLAAGALAAGGLLAVHAEAAPLFHSLTSARAVTAVILSAVAGLATLALVYTRRYEAARYTAAGAVAALIAGWALARWPVILPGLTVRRAAAGHDTLVWVTAAVLGGAVILAPSLGLLLRMSLAGTFEAQESGTPAGARAATPAAALASGLAARAAVACLIAGFGLLNLADARWEHALGVVCLLAFVALGFRAIALPALLEQRGEP